MRAKYASKLTSVVLSTLHKERPLIPLVSSNFQWKIRLTVSRLLLTSLEYTYFLEYLKLAPVAKISTETAKISYSSYVWAVWSRWSCMRLVFRDAWNTPVSIYQRCPLQNFTASVTRMIVVGCVNMASKIQESIISNVSWKLFQVLDNKLDPVSWYWPTNQFPMVF
jgi:hypothetical protein